MRIDLHLHTICSDGVYSPDEVINFAVKSGLEVISFTDHDTDAAYGLIDKATLSFGLRIIHGVEITANHEGNETHILGYFRNGSSAKLKGYLKNLQKARVTRINEGIKNLAKRNIKLSYDDLTKFSKGESIGRNHLANLLVENGYASDIKESFALYLKKDLNIVPQLLTPVKEVIEIIRDCDGIPVWAHPPQKYFDEYLPTLREYGLQGIEAFNFRKTGRTSNYYTDTARKLNLFVTAGSDWHGFEDELFPDKVYYKEYLTDKFVNYLFDN
jgi:3',5'-nucleoside bisphosphate phosphatase